MTQFTIDSGVNATPHAAYTYSTLPPFIKAASLASVIVSSVLLTACGSSGGDSGIDYSTYPVITLNGDAEISLEYGEEYQELGATVSDDVDTDLEVTISGDVDSSVLTDYTITYTATDSDGHISTITRTVSVNDLTAPVISLSLDKLDEETIELGLGRDYNELGATASDNVDGSVEVVTDSSALDVNTIGVYNVTYSATDEAGNTAQETRTVNVVAARPFITTWKTDNAAFSADDQIQLAVHPDYEGLYTFTVDWGDGETTTETGTSTHTYAESGTYTVSIAGDFPGMYAGALTGYDNAKLLTIEQWGDVPLQSMYTAFLNSYNLTSSAVDTPDLRLVNTLEYAFFNAEVFNGDISDWDISNVTNLGSTFSGALAFNQDISTWNTSSVTMMNTTFRYAAAFNQDISRWDTSKVTYINDMFADATSFDQDLSDWNIGEVKFFDYMFLNATLSTTNYDALLVSWSAQAQALNIRFDDFDGGCSEYSEEAQAAHDILTEDLGWTITYTCEQEE